MAPNHVRLLFPHCLDQFGVDRAVGVVFEVNRVSNLIQEFSGRCHQVKMQKLVQYEGLKDIQNCFRVLTKKL